VDESPHWAMPFVTVVVVTLIVTAVLLPTVIQPSTVEGMRSKFEGPEEHLENMLKFMSGPRFYALGTVSALFTTSLKMLAQAGIFSLLLLPLGGQVSFRKILGVTAYSDVVSAFGGVVAAGIMLATKSRQAYTNLNLFFPWAEKDTYLFRLLSAVDFFTIWSLVLFGLGLSVVGKIERRKTYVLVFSLWFAFILLLSFLGGIRAQFGGKT